MTDVPGRMVSKGPDGLPVAFGDAPLTHFPIQITAFDPDGNVVWERTVLPYVMVDIPAAPEGLAGKISIRTRNAEGTETWVHPEGGEGDGSVQPDGG